jgi:short-subunit dehydrogenase
MKLQNTVIIITGASAGIGEQIALRLASEGVSLALIARNEERLKEVADEAMKVGAKEVRLYPTDLSQTDALSGLVEKIATDFGQIDVLINNAGIWQKMMQLDEVSADKIDPIIATNLSSVVHLTHSVLPHLRNRPEAAILNIVSQSGVVAQGGQSIYTATKYGVRGFTDVLKGDLKESNVRVAGVYQAGTRTKMFEQQGETMPLEKFADPADLADIICYMLSQPPKIWMHEVRVTY